MSMRNRPQLCHRKLYSKINVRLYSANSFVSARRMRKIYQNTGLNSNSMQHNSPRNSDSRSATQEIPRHWNVAPSSPQYRAMAQSHSEGPGSVPGRSMCNLGWNGTETGFAAKVCTSVFPLSVSVHQCSILMCPSVTDATYRTQSWQLTASLNNTVFKKIPVHTQPYLRYTLISPPPHLHS